MPEISLTKVCGFIAHVTCTASRAAPDEIDRFVFEVSHPFVGMKAKGWGTERLWLVHFWPSEASALCVAG
jgi:hypothetical protein